MSQLGFERFGVWQTALNSSYLGPSDSSDPRNCLGGRCEFNPNIDLIDPNIDASMDAVNPDPETSILKDFTDQYRNNNMDVFWFSRPCMHIDGADILYDGTENPPFIRGVPYDDIDLREPSIRNRALEMMDHFVARGVKGFYVDAAGCPGDELLLREAKTLFRDRYQVDLFIAKEGVIDREALLWPQIPVLKLPGYNYSSSLLLNYLVPDGTYFGGAINSVLSDPEFEDILDKGYIGLPTNFPINRPNSWLCHILERTYQNYHQKWVNYGQNMGCTEPPLVPPACVDYPDVYYTIRATAGSNGTISPSGDVSAMEGTHPIFTITPDFGYRVSRVVVNGVPLARPVSTYRMGDVFRNGLTIHAEFEYFPPPPYTLTVNSEFGAIVKNPDLPSYDLDTPVTITAVPYAGFEFESWSGDITVSNNPVTVIMNNNKVITANMRSRNSASAPESKFVTCQDPDLHRTEIPICYELAEKTDVTLKIYSPTGQEIRLLSKGQKSSGFNNIVWDGKNDDGQKVASGTYIVLLETEKNKIRNKIVLIK
jgi:hypothetical protein